MFLREQFTLMGTSAMLKLSEWKRAFQRLGYPDKPRAERTPVSRLAAKYGLESAFTPAGIKDISTSGIYLITEKRLRTNELITLVLYEDGKPENNSELQVTVRAQVVRQGEDGVGLSFVLPPGLDAHLWEVLVRNIVTLTEPDQIAGMFRILRAIVFVCKLCQPNPEEAILLFGGQLDDEHVKALINIAITAEKTLASEPDFDRKRAHPALVANILREGSWAPDELMIRLWAGLLVSCCSVDVPDCSNQIFVDLLIQIRPTQARILFYACERFLASAQPGENSPSTLIVLTPAEITALTDDFDPNRNTTHVAHLFNLGLLQSLPNLASFTPMESFDVTPTNLCLELYRRCEGHRGMGDTELIVTAKEHLCDFLSQPPTGISQ
jgi:hypothetical protein